MKVLLYEHVSGGGSSDERISSSSLSEGFAMLRGLASDFKFAGHEVSVFLDPRVASFAPPLDADRVILVDDVRKALNEWSESSDISLIIAPETGAILSSMVGYIESIGLPSMNADADAIAKATDKASLYGRMRAIGVCVPETILCDVSDHEDVLRAGRIIGFPVIVKPVNGAGCKGISVARDEEGIIASIRRIRMDAPQGQVLIQRFIEGISASVSLISNGKEAVAISLNRQMITLSSAEADSSYDGGETPLEHPLRCRAFEVCERVIESFPGLKGYVGVDLMISGDEVFVIEVNARITSSYTGLRKVIDINIAQAVLDAVVHGRLPDRIGYDGYSRFSKVPIKGMDPDGYLRTYGIVGVASPPFPTGEDTVYSMVVSTGYATDTLSSTFNESKAMLLEACKSRQFSSLAKDADVRIEFGYEINKK